MGTFTKSVVKMLKPKIPGTFNIKKLSNWHKRPLCSPVEA